MTKKLSLVKRLKEERARFDDRNPALDRALKLHEEADAIQTKIRMWTTLKLAEGASSNFRSAAELEIYEAEARAEENRFKKEKNRRKLVEELRRLETRIEKIVNLKKEAAARQDAEVASQIRQILLRLQSRLKQYQDVVNSSTAPSSQQSTEHSASTAKVSIDSKADKRSSLTALEKDASDLLLRIEELQLVRKAARAHHDHKGVRAATKALKRAREMLGECRSDVATLRTALVGVSETAWCGC